MGSSKTIKWGSNRSVLLGFSFDTSNIQDEIANVFAVYNKYKAELLTGTKDPNQLVPK